MIIGKGSPETVLTEEVVRDLFKQAAGEGTFDNKKVLAVFPDHTRSGPVPAFFNAFCDIIGGKTAQLDFLIALGTHPPMTAEMINTHFGVTVDGKTLQYKNHSIFNHEWSNPKSNAEVGTLTKADVEKISGGLLSQAVTVRINRKVLEYDILAICGPVFPHEVVGFSGGNKYLYPGISEAEILNFFHWLGALITNPKVIGNKMTPVREVVEKCSDMVKIPKQAFCYVVNKGDVAGVFIGESRKAWNAAADLSKEIHICYKDKPFRTVLSCAPEMYDDLWTAGKCMYKLENVVEDNGTLIIYAPHVEEISYTHGKVLDRIGYHTRDYFAKQMEKFKGEPLGVLAHSTHVRGIGTFENGIEKPRIKVVLASKVSKVRCERINLGYMNPDDINIDDYKDKEDKGILYVAKAGETLYKLKNPPAWQK
jgi:nickel-dependent lactate racemase